MACAQPSGRPTRSGYKGIENLLRRIAFNLGNSPSQTEVKIISCIPIDVTDLQQKIICLEKQLEKLQGKKKRSDAEFPVVVNRVQLRAAYPPSAATDVPGENTKDPINDESPSHSSGASKNEPRTTILRDLNSYQNDSPTRNRTIFGKQIPAKDRTKLVYYAETATGNPFTNYKKATTNTNHNKLNETLDRAYLTSIIKRQYASERMYTGNEAQGSQLSAPICRDMPHCATTSDDMCSCCRGHFLDMDRKLHERSCYAPNIDSTNIYYDSSFYDIKPVKEEPNTSKRSNVSKKIKAFFPEYYQFNPADHITPHARSKSVKFPKKDVPLKPVFLLDDSSQTDGIVEFSPIYRRQQSTTRRLENSTDKSRNAKCKARSEINTESYMGLSKLIQTLSLAKCTSASANLTKIISENAVSFARGINETECSVVTAKALQTASLSKLGSTSIQKVTFKNAAVLALGMNETECQTDPAKYSEATSPPPPDKTESTLDQIKSILQTVLTEVKTSSRMRTIVEAKETKDAVVQMESASRPDCERLLGSFTYSGPMNNPRVASCSGGVPAYCSSVMRQTLALPPHAIDNSPNFNCMQNYPVFVQRTFATQHTCCSDRSAQAKQTSTNTLHAPPPPKKRTTETENLIKEIYKSMALNVDYPMQSASREVTDEATPAKEHKKVQSESVGANTMTLGREEIVYRGTVGPSRFNTRMVASPSSHSSLNIRRHRRSDSFHQPPRHITSSAQRRQFNVIEARPRPNEDEPESSSESESRIAAIIQPSAAATKAPPTIVKQGFFGKVASVMKRMRIKEVKLPQKKEKCINAIAEDSDSEFEMIVSPKVDKAVKHVSYAPAHHTPSRNVTQSVSDAARPTTSRTRRLGLRSHTIPGRAERCRREDRRMHQPGRMPRYVPPRSAMRQYSGSSQMRRAIHRPNSPHQPHTPPEYMRRVPYNQYEWRTTPHTYNDASLSAHANEYKPVKNGIKLTNKAWMRKPVHHLGFACGPEKTRILMQRY